VIDEKLLDIVVCPACHARLAFTEKNEALACTGCGRVYPIEDGLPVLLIERATLPG
jgi:hypothetical protein